MTPHKAQRAWHSLSHKWITASPFGPQPSRNPRRKRKIVRGVTTNFIPVEVVNAITGEISKGYMRDLSFKRLRKWLEFHNHRAQVEQILISKNVTFHTLLAKGNIVDFPVLIKLGKYQVPYLVASTFPSHPIRKQPTTGFNLKTVDNLKYLEIVANRKAAVMKLFNKIKKAKKK